MDVITCRTLLCISSVIFLVVLSAETRNAKTGIALGDPGPVEASHVLDAGGSANLTPFYAQTSWPTVHRDSRNSDYAPFVAPTVNQVAWTVLDGAATLLAPSIGPEGNVYITTGRGVGTSHLHAFDSNGNLLWESPKQTEQTDLTVLDAGAVGSAPIVDLDGDVYVSDSNQFWAFHSDGSLKWVVDLPEENHPFVSCIITNEGYVGGITTNGKVVLMHRDDGSLALAILDLPGGPGPEGPEAPDGMWAGGLMDPDIIQLVFDAFFGFGVEVTNTPAVDPETGRIFITATGEVPTEGVLYGIDVVEGELQVVFAAPIGTGSGTSPAISPDGSQVYAVGGDRVMIAVDAESGDVLWQASDTGAAASPAVGPDGTIYSGGGEFLIALNPEDGSVKWRSNFDAVAEAFLRVRRPSSAFPTGLPVARTNSVVSRTATQVWIVLVLGYEFLVPQTGNLLIQPHRAYLCSVDPNDGSLRQITRLRDTNEGVISVGSDGSLYVSHAARLSSIFFYNINESLPPFWRISGPPQAGLSALGPVSFSAHATAGVRWVRSLIEDASAQLPVGDLDSAAEFMGRGSTQLTATARTIQIDAVEELGPDRTDIAHDLVLAAQTSLAEARSDLPGDPAGAAANLATADEVLRDALAALEGVAGAGVDIMPGECPNEVRTRFNFFSRIDIALFGSAELDVEQVDRNSLVLERVDGAGRAVEFGGWRRKRAVRLADVGSPGGPNLCACGGAEPDGHTDLVLQVHTRELVRAFELAEHEAGTPLLVRLSGRLEDGTPFEASDCIVPAP